MENQISEYAMSVRARIDAQNGDLFENTSPAHARLIIKEFLRASQRCVQVFCGKLNRQVYGDLVQDFLAAIARGVEVQVLIEQPHAESAELAGKLLQEQRLRQIRDVADVADLPHFIVCDGKMYRLETHEGNTSALVCAYAPASESTNSMAEAMQNTFRFLWQERSVSLPADV